MREIVGFTPPDPLISESVWTRLVIDIAQTLGWRANHQRPAQTTSGRWMTATAGNTGFPDLCLAHAEHGAVFAELKSAKGRLGPEQFAWRDVLLASGQRWYLFRPADFADVVAVLSGKSV